MPEAPLLAPQGDCIEIDGERCLLALNAASRCEKCAAACPVGAIIVSDDGLGVAEDVCNGCGECAPVCPQQAIDWKAGFITAQEGRQRVAFAGCEPAIGKGGIACLHGLSLDALCDGARQGVDLFALGFGDCASCAAHPKAGNSLQDRLKLMRLLLESRGFTSPKAEALSVSEFHKRLRAAESTAGQGPAFNRRSLFARIAPAALASTQLPPRSEALYLGLPHNDAANVMVFVPRIDEMRCTGCDACARLCPTGAIRFEKSGDGAHYVLDAALCNGCALCVDVCEDQAMVLAPSAPAPPVSVALGEKRCPACGARHHRPIAQSNDKDHCRICQKANHYANLHQVIR